MSSHIWNGDLSAAAKLSIYNRMFGHCQTVSEIPSTVIYLVTRNVCIIDLILLSCSLCCTEDGCETV
jgi:hypothetical protein